MNKRLFLLSTFFFFIFPSIHAATFQSTQTGNWSSPSTWGYSCTGCFPTASDDVIITAGHDVTIDGGATGYTCKSLTVNGKLIYAIYNTFTVGDFNNRTASFVVNGTFEFTGGYGFIIYGYLKFNTGSIFRMYAGGITLDGALAAGTSVPAGQAILDVTDIGTLDVYRSTITIRNPHLDPSTPCVKGAKRFGNTLSFGEGNMTDVGNDFTVSETDKPELGFVAVNSPNPVSRFKATNLQIDSAVSILAGNFYNYSNATPISVKGDFNVNPGVTVTGNIQFNGLTQQNINPQYLSSATDITFHGDIIVNNPTEVKSKINVTIQGGDLRFVQGNFDTEHRILTLERTPINANSSHFIITYNFYQDHGSVLIKNLSGNTLFPVGISSGHYAYSPVWINAASGDFKVSLTPALSSAPSPPAVPAPYDYVNLVWTIENVSGPPTANITFQWNGSEETGNFATYRNNCRLFNTNGTTWNVVTPNLGPDNTSGSTYTKSATGVSSFTSFALFASAVLPVEISQFSGKKQDNRAQLTWTTVSETDNQGFEIQKDTEGGRGFETIGFVKGQGNTQKGIDYVFWDNDWAKTAYYRLKQMDISGKQTFSKIITIESGNLKGDMSVFPNPILRGGRLTIQTANNVDTEDFNLEVFNAHGQTIAQQKGIAPLQTDTWQNGVYFVKIVKHQEVVTFKVLKNN